MSREAASSSQERQEVLWSVATTTGPAANSNHQMLASSPANKRIPERGRKPPTGDVAGVAINVPTVARFELRPSPVARARGCAELMEMQAPGDLDEHLVVLTLQGRVDRPTTPSYQASEDLSTLPGWRIRLRWKRS